MFSYISLLLMLAVSIGSDASRSLSCTAIASIYSIPSAASSFCSSYLGIRTLTTTSTEALVTGTTTVTAVDASTTTTFLPGNPPAAKVRRGGNDRSLQHSSDFLSSACRCLDLATHTVTVLTTTSVITTITASVVTETVYPCATTNGTLPSPGPAYGKAQSTADLGLSNNIYYLDTPEGANASACCNTCFFEIENCVQAWWYFYEGCVVSQASVSGSGSGVSDVCPSGTLDNLTYVPDYDPAFRSTGDIAGPCGVDYTNF